MIHTYQEWMVILEDDQQELFTYATWASCQRDAEEDAVFNTNLQGVRNVTAISMDTYRLALRTPTNKVKNPLAVSN
jgi:hypothetical protein